MNHSPLCADTHKILRNGSANFYNFSSSKPHLFYKGYRAVGATQIELGPRPIRLDRVDMRRWMIVGIDHHADVSKPENCGHASM